jgi:hypothetical protein
MVFVEFIGPLSGVLRAGQIRHKDDRIGMIAYCSVNVALSILSV